ncbi:MAG: HDIG domain-containing metalloprotein [Bacteroidota bacterium]
MEQFLDYFRQNKALIYKGFLSLFTIFLVIYLFPKGLRFKYEFRVGETWRYEDLYAPFDFSVENTRENTGEAREEQVRVPDYFQYDQDVATNVNEAYRTRFDLFFKDSTLTADRKNAIKTSGEKLLAELYDKGVVATQNYEEEQQINVVKKDEVIATAYKNLFTDSEIDSYIKQRLRSDGLSDYYENISALFSEIVRPNVFLDNAATQEALRKKRAETPATRTIERASPLIFKGDKIDQEKYLILTALKEAYELKTQDGSSRYWIIFGYILITALVILMLFLFLWKYRYDIYINNTKVTFIFFTMVFMLLLTTMVLRYDATYIYVVPLCILPLTLNAFFDARLSLFVHILVVLLLGFIVPNNFEYMVLQIIAGIVSVQTVSELYRRANLFISVGQITLSYIIVYFAFHVVGEGNLSSISWLTFGFFALNGLVTLFAQPLVYIYEKIFGLVSDVSLLELSHTNSKLLKRMSDEAPGTFHHSLQVANLAEAVANEIGANAMLIRVGALYHDIGKMRNPTYFTENQITGVNAHDALAPEESARIIINHVTEGVEMARKNKLPERVIDFIRTHHGTSLVYYFYKKKTEQGGEVNENDFRYPGPIPFSKEMAVVMMCDAVEAASKSLKEPTFSVIDDFVEKIISKQAEERQFLNADITFREIETVKKVLKQKLTNIYHLRIEYPE